MGVIPVVFCFDKRIILGASVSIKSLIDNANEDTVYDIRVFHSDLSPKLQSDLGLLVKDTRHKMQFHTVDEKRFKNAPSNRGSWHVNVYYRLLTPEILTEYDKAIYSDVDVLFKGDLSEIYNSDLETYEAAAVPSYTVRYLKETGSKRYFEENKNEKNYMSGFVIFNNKLMREEKTVDKFFDTIDKFGKRLVYFDMDVFNLTCTRIKDIPLNYCVFETFYEYTDITRSTEYKLLKTLYSDEYLQDVIKNPVIIHYAGQLGKPWQRKWVPEYYQEYINKIPKVLRKYTFRDLRKKYFSKVKYPIQHFDVGLVNFYHSQNYGACLTAYALQETVKGLGYSCAYAGEFKVRKKYNLSFGKLFVNKYLRLMPKFNSLKKAGEMADTYITGSDQVFRPDYMKKKRARELFLLNFVSKNAKKISCSASFGVGLEEFEDSKKHIIKDIINSLKTFDYVSTREFAGVDICKSNGIYAEQIIDPVFMLEKNKYEKLTEKVAENYKNKILVYVLDKNPVYQALYDKLKKQYNLEICNIAGKNLSVEEWLKAYMDSDYIITDSFHGTCFALIFNKKFISIVNSKRGASRFETLSEIFGLKEQFVYGTENIDTKDFVPYDFEIVNKKINSERVRGIEKLKHELGTKRNNFITETCTGCGACAQICPHNAIKMEENNEGFLYPKVDRSKCVNCGLCQKTCPTRNNPKSNNSAAPKCYAVMAEDDLRLSGVSSGGASQVIMRKMINDGGYVFGAQYNDDWKIEHASANNAEGIEKFKGSKYFQSTTLNTYREVKELLNQGKKVLYTGTPCQIAGLKSFLGKDNENLLTVDIVCHGVPSYKLLHMFLGNLIKDKSEKVLGMDFRSKINGWTPVLNTSTSTTKTIYKIPAVSNPFMVAFLRNLALRKSCFTCPFQKTPRQGDITIGDFWRIQRYKQALDDKKGTSLVVINNEKGAKFFGGITEGFKTSEEVPYKYAVKGNGTLVHPTRFNPDRDYFMANVTQDNLYSLVKRFAGKKFKEIPDTQ